MAGSLTDGGARLLGLDHRDRRVLLVAALAGGFGSVFGVPVAGAVFGLEVQPGGRRLRLAAMAPALVASVVGDRVVRLLDVHHTPTPTLDVDLGPALLAKVALAAVAFGLVSAAFAVLVHRLRAVVAERVGWAPLRPVLGGLAVIALTLLVGTRDYLGLSLPLLGEALAGADVAPGAFALKLLFTVVTLGCGFQGGEVTPLFVIGATCGAALGEVLGVPLPLMAAVGLAAVFAGATKTPLACTVLGVELFGWGPVLPLALACAVAVAVSGGPGIYVSATRPAPPARWGRGQRRR
jgi:H+/Cl- antiporter ClcA